MGKTSGCCQINLQKYRTHLNSRMTDIQVWNSFHGPYPLWVGCGVVELHSDLELMSQCIKLCNSRFNGFYIAMGYVSKIWVLGCPAPFNGGLDWPIKSFVRSWFTVPNLLALAATAGGIKIMCMRDLGAPSPWGYGWIWLLISTFPWTCVLSC